jgi:hypothetical protein
MAPPPPGGGSQRGTRGGSLGPGAPGEAWALGLGGSLWLRWLRRTNYDKGGFAGKENRKTILKASAEIIKGFFKGALFVNKHKG